jgi:hypothetical protein
MIHSVENLTNYRDEVINSGRGVDTRTGGSFLPHIPQVRQRALGTWRAAKFASFERRFGSIKQVSIDALIIAAHKDLRRRNRPR